MRFRSSCPLASALVSIRWHCLAFLFAPVTWLSGADIPATLETAGPGTTRLLFEGSIGETYRVEQAEDLSGPWELQATVVVDEPLEAVEFVTGSGTVRRFWRVVREGADGALEISPILALHEQASDGPTAAFEVVARSPAGIDAVRFYSDGLLRGLAELSAGDHWIYRESYDPENPETVALAATAEDGLGATVSTPVARFLLADPARFVPLDEAGVPQPGRFVPVNADGSLTAFEWRPDGRAPLFAQTGMRFRFASGALLTMENGRAGIRSGGGASLVRGWYDEAPAVLGGGGEVFLPLEDLGAREVALLLHGDASQPVELRILPGRGVLWHDGAVGDEGLDQAETSPTWEELAATPLPGRPKESELAEDAESGELIYRAKYHGTYTLPGGVEVKIPRQSPWIFVFHADGRIALSGETRIRLPNGGRFHGSVSFRNGRVCFSLQASKLAFDTLGSLLELLPEDPAACVPGSAEDQAMNLAAACLEAYARSYRNFAAGAVRISDVDLERDLEPLPTPFHTGTAALEAWAWRMVALEGESPNNFLSAALVDRLAELTDHAADAARSSYDLPGLLAWQRAITRFRQAVEAANAAGQTGDAAALQQRLDEATRTLLAALDRHLRETEPDELVPLLEQVLGLLLEIEEWRQKADADETVFSAPDRPEHRETNAGPDFPTLAGRVADVVGRRFLAELGVVTDEFDPVLNDTVLALDRFSAAAALRQTLDLWALLALLGRDDLVADLPIMEAMQQLTTHLADVHEADVRDALDRRSFPLAFIVMRQRLDLMAQIALLGLEDEFPQFADPGALLSRWDSIAEELLQNPTQEWRREGLLEALRYVRRTLAFVPERAGSYSADLREDLEELLEEFYTSGRLNTALTPRDWLEWLEGGILHDHLGRLYFTTSFHEAYSQNETRSRLEILVDGLVAASGGGAQGTDTPQAQFAFLDQAAQLLLGEIQTIRIEVQDASLPEAVREQRRAMRLAYLRGLGRLLRGYQTVATRLYADAAGQPGSLAFFSDLLLPGDIRIHQLAGAACFEPASGSFEGRFSGEVELPKFDSRLKVANASFDSRGNFALAAWGQAAFPGAPTPPERRVAFSVPARRPLSIQIADTGRFSISGGASLKIPGGHTFSGYLSIDDPEYVFELAYGGKLRLDLLEKITLVRPTLEIDPETPLDLGVSAALAAFYGSLTTGFEAFIEDASAIPSAADLDPGAPPEFQNPVVTAPTDALDAWITSLVNEAVVERLNGTFDDAVGSLRGLLQSIDEELAAARADLAPDLLQLQRLQDRVEFLTDAQTALDTASERALMGEEDQAELLERAREGAAKAMEAANAYLEAVPEDAELPFVFAALELNLSSVALSQAVGLETTHDPALLAGTLRKGGAALLEGIGLAPDGTVEDAARLAATSDRRLLVLARVFLDLEANEQAAALDEVELADPIDYQGIARSLLARVRDRKYAAYTAARDGGNLAEQVLNATWLMEFNGLVAHGLIEPNAGIAENYSAFEDTLATIRARRGAAAGSPTEEKLAWDFVQAAFDNIEGERRIIERETSEQLGNTPETRVHLDPAGEMRFGSHSLWDLLAVNWEVLQEQGLLDASALADMKLSLGGALQAYREAFTADNSIDVTFVEENFNTLYATLLTASDLIAWMEEHLPNETGLVEEWKASWEALSIEFIGVAETRQAWWYLEAYTRSLAAAAERYGSGLSTATAARFATVGTQAVASLATVTDHLGSLFEAVDFETFDFRLPGDLTVERLYGRLAFNRLSGDWAVAFGGAVRFPEMNLFFALDRAALASNGAFDLRLRTRGPAPFGFDDTLRLEVANAFALTGNLLTPAITNASASGTLLRQPSDGSGLETYTVALSYSYTDPGQHRFDFNSTFSDDLEVFTEDLVIFRGGFGFSLALDASLQPTQTAFTASSTVGLLAREQPLPDNPSPGDFQLLFEGTAAVAVASDRTDIILGPGVMKLPAEFEARACGLPGVPVAGSSRPTVSVPAENPLAFTWYPAGADTVAGEDSGFPEQRLARSDGGTIEFSGALAFEGLRFSLPEIEDLWIDVCSLTLEFGFDSASLRPTAILKNLNGQVSVPLPGQSLRVGLEVEDWSIDRLPAGGTFYLAEDLTLLQAGGFVLHARGGRDLLGIPRTGISLITEEESGRRGFIVTGTYAAAAAGWFEDRQGNPTTIEGELTGFLSVLLPAEERPLGLEDLTFDLPRFEIAQEGELFLGGESGLAVVDPRLTLLNPLRALEPSAEAPFTIGLDLGLRIVTGAGYDFTVRGEQMQLIFDGSADAPLVALGALGGCLEAADLNEGEPVSLTADLPFHLRRFCLNLKNLTGDDPVPLFPDSADELPAFSVDNVEILLSAGLALPPGAPILTGDVNDLVVGFSETGVPTVNIDGIGLGVDLTEYLGDAFPMGGTVFIGGFQSGNYYFSGKVRGNLKGNLVEGIVAFDTAGLRGICFGLAGAELAIQIGYGFVLTGARGGLALGNGSVDPCDFVSLLNIDPVTGKPSPDGPGPGAGNGDDPFGACPLLTWEELQDLKEGSLDREAIALDMARAETVQRLVAEDGLNGEEAAALVDGASAEDLADLNAQIEADHPDSFCPTPGNCPPASLGVLAQPHPEAFLEGSPYAGRAIIKFTSINEATLNAWGIDRALIDSQIPALEFDRDQLAARFGEEIRIRIEALVPRPPGDLPEPLPDWATTFEEELQRVMDDIELGFFNGFTCALDALGAPTDRDDLVDRVYQAVRDTAYAGIPYTDVTFRLEGSFSYTAVSSFASVTAGAIVSTSGTYGINGTINLFGLPVGYLRAFVSQFDAYGNPSAGFCGEADLAIGPLELGTAGLLYDCPGCETRLFDAFLGLGEVLSGDYVYALMQRVDPSLAEPDLTPGEHFARLDTDERKFAFLAGLLNTPPVGANGTPTSAYRAFLVELADALAPRLALCGAIQPKLFGFSLGGDKVVQGLQFYAGPKDPENIAQGYQFFSEYRFSPFQTFAQSLLAPAGGASALATLFLPVIDEATATTAFEADSLGTLLNDALVLPPNQFLDQRVSDFVATSVSTFEYELSPFGLELGRAGGRFVFPSWEHHPQGADPLVPPEERGLGLPTEQEVLFAALGQPGTANLLADPFWKGSAGELVALFAETPYAAAMASAEPRLIDDYFPHGGILGAAEFNLPKLLTEGLPESYFLMIDAGANLADRFAALQTFLGFVGQTETAGQLSFYLPAPNPPSLLTTGFPASPQELLADLRRYDPGEDLNQLYPAEEAFLRGWIEANLLGLPTARAELLLVPEEQLYRLTAAIPAESWFGRMLGEAEFVAQIRQGVDADEPIETLLRRWQDDAVDLAGANAGLGQLALLNQVVEGLHRRLPRLNVNFEAARFRVPFPGYDPSDPLAASSTGILIEDLAFAAYSPQFDPAHAGDGLLDRIRREGGIGLQGSFAFDAGGVELGGAAGSFILGPNPNLLGLPSVAGEFTASSLAVDGMTFLPQGAVTGSLEASDERLALIVSAEVPQLPLLLFDVIPPQGEDTFRLRALLEADQTSFPAASLEIGPARIDHPAFGGDTVALLHGASTDKPFTLNSAAPWTAAATIRNPAVELTAGQVVIARLSGAGVEDLAAAVSGNGTSVESLLVENLPSGLVVETFPDVAAGDLRHHTLTIGAAASGSLLLESGGRFRLDLESTQGSSQADLNGASLDAGFTLRLTEEAFSLEAHLASLPLPGFGTLRPREDDRDDRLSLEAEATIGANLELTLEPARFEFALPMVQTDALVDGGVDFSGRPLALSFRTDGAWSGRIVIPVLRLDPDDRTGPLPEFVELGATDGRGTPIDLFTATLTGDGLDSLAFSAVRTGRLNAHLLDGTPFERIFTGFSPGDQSVSLDTSGNFRLAVQNFAPGTFELGTLPSGSTTVPLLSVTGSDGSDLIIDNEGLEFRLTEPKVSVAGESIGSSGVGTFAARFAASGGFAADFTTSSAKDLFGDLLQLRAGTHTLSGDAANLAPTLGLSTAARLNLVVPRLVGSTFSTTTLVHDFALELDAGSPFTFTWDPSSSTGFDVGWARVEAGALGRVHVGRTNSDFSVRVENWDVYLLGEKFDNQLDLGFSSTGAGSLTLGSATFDFASGEQYWIQLVTNAGVPFSWNADTGAITMRFPTQTDLKLPGAGLLSGTFVSGLDIPTSFPVLGTDGTFDHTFNRTINLNGVDFGSVGVRFYRTSPNGNLRLLIDHSIGGDFAGLDLDVYLSSGNRFRMRLVGELNVPLGFGWGATWATLDGDGDGQLELASVDLDLSSNVLIQFQGTATLLGSRFDVSLGSGDAYIAPNAIGWARFPLPRLPD